MKNLKMFVPILFFAISFFFCNNNLMNDTEIGPTDLSDQIIDDWILYKAELYDSLNVYTSREYFDAVNCPTYLKITKDKMVFSVVLNCETGINKICFNDFIHSYDIVDVSHIDYGDDLHKAYFHGDTLVIENMTIFMTKGMYKEKRYYIPTKSFHVNLNEKCN